LVKMEWPLRLAIEVNSKIMEIIKMKRIAFFLLLIFALSASVYAVTADELVKQGDQFFLKADYGHATEAYVQALALEPDNQAIKTRHEKAIVAKNADEFLSLMTREVQKKGDIRISAKTLVKKMVKGEKLTLVDIRTPEEQALTRVTGSLSIQMTDIMKNLDRIPTDGTVVIICHSSPRAIIVTTALRILGYNNVYALKGGIMAIANLNAKKVPDGLKPLSEGR